MTATNTKMTAKDVVRTIYRHFTPAWAVLTEVTARAAYTPPQVIPRGDTLMPIVVQPGKVGKDRRIDVLMLRQAAVTGGIERLAIEVKVTRADFLSDVGNPDKQAPWRALAHRHAYAVPDGLVSPSEVPAESGLLAVTGGDYPSASWVRVPKTPVGHDPGPLPLPNQMDAWWRAARAESQIRGYGYGTAGGAEDELRAEVLRLRKRTELLDNQMHREVELRRRWQRAYAAHGCPPCGTCGRPLHLTRSTRRGVDWEHRDPGDAAGCDTLRRAAAVERNNALPEKNRLYLWVAPPEPADLTSAPKEE